MAPRSASERYNSVRSSKLNEPFAPLGSRPSQPVGARPPRKPNKSKHNRCASASGCESYERHSRKCQICNHPERKAIEADFFNWKAANRIRETYGLHGMSTIYRHARATGLDARRHEHLCMLAEEVLENVDAIKAPSASLIIRAVRALASLNERGQWLKPPAPHHVVSTTASPVPSSFSSTTTVARRAPRRSPMEAISNRHTNEGLEIPISHSKQTPEGASNRHT